MTVCFYTRSSDVEVTIANDYAFKLLEMLGIKSVPEGSVKASSLIARIGRLRERLENEAPVFVIRPAIWRGGLSQGLTRERFVSYLDALEGVAQEAPEVRWL